MLNVIIIICEIVLGYLIMGAAVAMYFDFVVIPRKYEEYSKIANEMYGETLNEIFNVWAYLGITLRWPWKLKYIDF